MVTSLGQYGPSMYDVKSSPVKATPKFGSGARFDREKAYEGKETKATMLGSFGPGMYDVKLSPIKRTPKFGSGARFDREKAYEGKAADKRGQFGPGLYDVRCSNRGSPLLKGRGPSAAFALPSRRA